MIVSSSRESRGRLKPADDSRQYFGIGHTKVGMHPQANTLTTILLRPFTFAVGLNDRRSERRERSRLMLPLDAVSKLAFLGRLLEN